MPGNDLTGFTGFAGFWGKLPTTGDFVGRGLPREFRGRWDAWVTRHLAPRPEPWPRGHLRLRLASGGRTASGIVLPSADAAERQFPLSALAVLPFAPARADVDEWCEAALPPLMKARAGEMNADELWDALESLPRPLAPMPEGEAAEPKAPLLLWARGTAALAADPDDPGPALDALSSR